MIEAAAATALSQDIHATAARFPQDIYLFSFKQNNVLVSVIIYSFLKHLLLFHFYGSL